MAPAPPAVHRHFLVPLLFIAWATSLLASCSDAELSSCREPCPEGTACVESVGQCIAPLTRLESPGALVPALDAVMLDGEFHLLVQDRLGGLFVYGQQDRADAPVWWQGIAASPMTDPTRIPAMRLVSSASRREVVLETQPGELTRFVQMEGRWQTEYLGDLSGPLQGLDAVVDSKSGLHLCVADAQGTLHYGYARPGEDMQFDEPELAGLALRPTGPCALSLVGDRVLLLAGALPRGLVALSHSDDSGWKEYEVDAEVMPWVVRIATASEGPVAVYVDQSTGRLLAAEGFSAQTYIATLDVDAAGDGWTFESRPPSLDLTRIDSDGTLLLAYYDAGSGLATAMTRDEDGWSILARTEVSGNALVRVGTYPAGEVVAAILELGEDPMAPSQLSLVPLLVD